MKTKTDCQKLLLTMLEPLTSHYNPNWAGGGRDESLLPVYQK